MTLARRPVFIRSLAILSLSFGEATYAQDAARTTGEVTVDPDLEPCPYVAAARSAEGQPWFEQEMGIERLYDPNTLSPLYFQRDADKDTAKLLDEFHLKVRRIFAGLGLFAEPLQGSGVTGHPRIREYTMYRMDYDPVGQKRDWQQGHRFIFPEVRLTVVNSEDPRDIQRAYAVARYFRPRQLPSILGSFDDPGEVIGDVCYHLSTDTFGFCRGNVIAELHFRTAEWRDGSVIGLGGLDKELRQKMLEASRQIDDLLLREMFAEQVRTEIRAREAERRRVRGTSTQPAAPNMRD